MMKPGKPNIWGSGRFKKVMKNSRVDDIIGFAASLNKTQEVKVKILSDYLIILEHFSRPINFTSKIKYGVFRCS